MRKFKLLLIIIIANILLGAPAFSQEFPRYPEAERLVRSIGFVEMFKGRAVNYLKVAKPPMTKQAQLIRTFMEKIVSTPSESLVFAFAKLYSTVPPEDALLAAQALETPIGRKIIQGSIESQVLYGGDIIAARDANPFSEEELQQLKELNAGPGWQAYLRLTKIKINENQLKESLSILPEFAEILSSE